MNYDSFATTFSNSRRNHPWPELDAIIEDMRANDVKSVLDIGCGNGRFLEEIRDWRLKITDYLGTDNSGEMILEAQKLHSTHHFCVFPMETLKHCGPAQEWSPFDAILLLASFHHLSTRDARIETLRDVQAFLSPWCRIYMTNWNLRDQEKYRDSETSEGEYEIKIWSYSRYYHGFTVDELEWLFTEAGYTIVEHRIFEWGRNIYSILTV